MQKRSSAPFASALNGTHTKRPRSNTNEEDGAEPSYEEDLILAETMEEERLHDAEEPLTEDFLSQTEDETVSGSQRWSRPPVAELDPQTMPLVFQWVDIDMTTGDPLKSNPTGEPVPGSQFGPVPIVRMYGVTENGNSVLLHCHGFTPYFFAELPVDYIPGQSQCGQIRERLNANVRERARGDEKKLRDLVLAVTVETNKQSILGYRVNHTKAFLQIAVATPSLVPGVKRLLEDGADIPGYGKYKFATYESNVPFVLRFMIDNNISGKGLTGLRCHRQHIRCAKTLKISQDASSRWMIQQSAHADVVFENISAHAVEGIWGRNAPLRILSFDIECQGRKGHFPEAQHDPVIQIGNALTIQGSKQPLIRNVFTLGGCLAIPGAQVITSVTEVEMLHKWRCFIQAVDPDIITGYNVQNFDVPYLLNRAKVLEKNNEKMKRFPEWGRIRNLRSTMKDTTFQSSAYGKRENIETTIHGRVLFDMLPYMFRNHKLSSYSLNSVCSEFLNQQKEDVHHSIIADLQHGSDADRRRLAVYCLKDALLPQLLMDKLSVMVNYIEMARVTGVPLNYLLTRGQQIKVFSMLLRKCRRDSLLVPNLPKSQGDDTTYEGATVIEPMKAYYEVPIATLDFASLYPSIMQAYNLCYSTLVAKDDANSLAIDSYAQTPSGDYFVKAETKRGILPQILDELLAARKQAKKDMKNATDEMERAVQNGRQLALKVSANSVYGFTGATVGQLPCIAIASSVTAYGRQLLLRTKEYVETRYTVENGFPASAQVVYGDTDSVMVKFGVPSVQETMVLAERAASEVSKIFPAPIRLEFEKVYFPYLLMNKKRYAGLLWTNAEKYDKMDAKGLETVRFEQARVGRRSYDRDVHLSVRRDNCLLVRKLVDTCLRKILIDRDVQGAIDYAKGIISDLLQNKMDISMLVITKSLAKSADSEGYANKQAHVELAVRMRKRDPGTAPNVGDRVPYVFIQAGKNTPAYLRSEDPVHVLENNLPIDTEYYLQNQLANPLQRLFEPIISNPQALLTGSHTLSVKKLTPSAKAGGIMSFAVKKLKCLGCKAIIAGEDELKGPTSVLCVHCMEREDEIYAHALEQLHIHEEMYSKLWTQCQRCQGSLHSDVICTNRDCPIFYKRKKVQMDVKQAQESLDRFSW